VRTSLSAFFSWAAREGYIDANPAAFTNKAIENGSRERVLADDELAEIWHAAGRDQYGAIVKLLMLTGARRDEIAGLRWSEVDLDVATITLPPARTKNRREHVIPLSDQALTILEAQPRRVDADGTERDHVFGYGRGRGWQNWSGNKADLDKRIASARKSEGLDWRLHDFRRSLSTALHERFKVAPHVVEAILGHVGGHKAGVAGIYNKALYLDERRRSLDRWAAYIDALVSSKPKQTTTEEAPVEQRTGWAPSSPAGSDDAVAEADDKKIARRPEVHFGEVKVQSESRVSAVAKVYIDIDRLPVSPLEWLEEAVGRLKATPDCPQQRTEAARRLRPEMAEAFRRRLVANEWSEGHIVNTMRTHGLWPEARPKKA
jgi:hypothetical protein